MGDLLSMVGEINAKTTKSPSEQGTLGAHDQRGGVEEGRFKSRGVERR
jgi:hypothetical protein